MGKLAILGEMRSERPSHVATNEAIGHVIDHFDLTLTSEWISSSEATTETLSEFDGLWIAPGPPYEDLEMVLEAIRFAREQKIPLLGTCQGFQSVVLEFARNVLEMASAEHEEYSPNAECLVITQQECSLVGREMELTITPNSRAGSIYGATKSTEKYYCNYRINPEYVESIRSKGLRIVGSDESGEARVVELDTHPFFVATLFVPQASSSNEKPHPIVRGFLEAVCSEANRS